MTIPYSMWYGVFVGTNSENLKKQKRGKIEKQLGTRFLVNKINRSLNVTKAGGEIFHFTRSVTTQSLACYM